MSDETKMTADEAEALYNANADGLMLHFAGYYKYSFTFKAETNDMLVLATFGGDHNDIYRHEVGPEPIKAPADFVILLGEYYSVTIKNKQTGQEFHHYDF